MKSMAEFENELIAEFESQAYKSVRRNLLYWLDDSCLSDEAKDFIEICGNFPKDECRLVFKAAPRFKFGRLIAPNATNHDFVIKNIPRSETAKLSVYNEILEYFGFPLVAKPPVVDTKYAITRAIKILERNGYKCELDA